MTEQAGTAKAWGGRFAQAPDRRLEAFNASVAFDVRLVREDIRGSIAHARMLGKQGIIGAEDAADARARALAGPRRGRAGDFTLTIADEDVHTGVERRLREIVGRSPASSIPVAPATTRSRPTCGSGPRARSSR